MKIFSKIKDKINRKLQLIQSKIRGKRYVYLQKPVKDMSYNEACKEVMQKESIIFCGVDKFNGRNGELIKKVIFESKNNDFAIDCLVKLLNNDIISKSVKIDFIDKFCTFFDDNELCRIIGKNDIDDNFKVLIVRRVVDRIPEEFIIKYFDYTNPDIEYLKKVLKNVSVDGKIDILNNLSKDEVKKELLIDEVNNLEFNDAKKMYEQVVVYGYKEIEDFYIKKIETLNSEQALEMLKEMSYISPSLAEAFDKTIEPKDVKEVVDYINNNSVKKGGLIYLNRKFNVQDKKEIFYNIKNEEIRKNALVIFSEDLGKREFVNMVKCETNENIKLEMINNANMFMKVKQFSDDEIEKLRVGV